MTDNESPKRITRRELLKGAGVAGAAAILPGPIGRLTELEGEVLPDPGVIAKPLAVPSSGLQQSLTVEELEILDAMIGRLIPSDEHGPGAREAGALGYIDRELGGALARYREAYRAGLFALDGYAEAARGARFSELASAAQDSLLFDLQAGGAGGAEFGFLDGSTAFFNMVRDHTWEATFGDPVYGGNRDFIGWDLIRYPGPRRAVTREDQAALESGELEPLRRSAHE
jgi:gluconate 2-dehydrogenase gamma chain